MQWGKNVEALTELQATGMPVPALDNAPAQRPELAVFLRCFMDVSTDRSFNGHITFAAVARWCEVFELPVGEFWAVVRLADNEVRRWHESKR